MDLELIKRVRNGESQAFELVLLASNPIIYKIISIHMNEYGDYMIDKDEMYQIATIGLYEACLKYNENKGMSFSSFSYLVIKSKLINYYKRSIKVYSNEYYSIDADHDGLMNHVGIVSDSAYSYHKEQEFHESLNNFINELSEEDRLILEYKRQNMPYIEISKRLNISIKRVSNRLQIMREKFSKYRRK